MERIGIERKVRCHDAAVEILERPREQNLATDRRDNPDKTRTPLTVRCPVLESGSDDKDQ